jgi:beta-lactamase class A
VFLTACASAEKETTSMDVAIFAAEIQEAVASSGAEVGLYYRSLGGNPDSALINPDLRMHAASTMKVPLMMQLYLDHQSGDRSLDSEVPVKRTFTSIVDGSEFDLPPESDSDTTFYGRVGEEAPVRDMIDRMITWSSNLATNILIEVVDGRRVTRMLRDMGADSMEVLRGVEDLEAFRAGLSNTTTARDLGLVMREVAEGDRFTPASRAEMLAVLERQHFRENIPAGLPPGTQVANKTGWITGINHDAAVVFPETADAYVLVIMLRGHPAEDQGTAFAAELSRIVWEHHTGT